MINVINKGGDRERFVKFMEPVRMRKSWEIKRNYNIQNLSQLGRKNLKKYKIIQQLKQEIKEFEDQKLEFL